MKKIFTTLAIIAVTLTTFAQNNLGINTNTPHTSAALMVDTAATGGPQGVLIPRMTQARRNAIVTPATGLLIYQTDITPGFYNYNGTAWIGLGVAAITYPNVELNVNNNVSQNITSLANTANTSILTISGTNNGTLTGGNTWDGSVFATGASGAGFYQISIQVKGVTSTNTETNVGLAYFMELNNSGIPLYSSTYDLYANGQLIGIRNQSKINGIIYLNANTSLRFKGQSWSTTATHYTSIDGSTTISIIRIK